MSCLTAAVLHLLRLARRWEGRRRLQLSLAVLAIAAAPAWAINGAPAPGNDAHNFVGRTRSTVTNTGNSTSTIDSTVIHNGTGSHVRAGVVLGSAHTLHSEANVREGFERFDLPDPAASSATFYGLGVLHPSYSTTGFSDHDIALLLLLNGHSANVGGMLPAADANPLGATMGAKDVTFAGYNNQGTYMEGNVRAKLGEGNFVPATDTGTHIYTFRTANATPAGTSKHYTQKGDSGGPTFYSDGTNELLVGITRSGVEPKTSEVVRVDTHREFIDGGTGTSDRTLNFLKASAAGSTQAWSSAAWSRGSGQTADKPATNNVVVLDPTNANNAANTTINLDEAPPTLDGLLNDVTLNISGHALNVNAEIGSTGGTGVLNGGVLNVGDAAGSQLTVGYSLENVGVVTIKKNGVATIGAKHNGTEPVGVLNGARTATFEVLGGGTLTLHNTADRVMFTNLASGAFKLTGGADGAAAANIDRFLNLGSVQIGDKGNLSILFKLTNAKTFSLEGSSEANVAEASVKEFVLNFNSDAQINVKKNGLFKAPKGLENSGGTVTLEGAAADQLAKIESLPASGYFVTKNVNGVVTLKKFSQYSIKGKFENLVSNNGPGKLFVSEAGNVAGPATMEATDLDNIGAQITVSQLGSLKVNGLLDNASTNSESGKLVAAGVEGMLGTIEVKKLDNSADVTIKAHGKLIATGMGGVSVVNSKNISIEANGSATLHGNVENSGKFTVKGADIATLKTLEVKKGDGVTKFKNKAGGAIELDPVLVEFEDVDLDNEGDLLGVGEFHFVGQSSFINQRSTAYPSSDSPYDTRDIDFRFNQAIGTFEVSSLVPNMDPVFGSKFGLNDPFAVHSLIVDNGSNLLLQDAFDNQILPDALFAGYLDIGSSSSMNRNSVDIWVNSNVESHLNQLISLGSLYDGTLSGGQTLIAKFVPQFGATHIEVVPEPATFALLVGALIAAWSSRRRPG